MLSVASTLKEPYLRETIHGSRGARTRMPILIGYALRSRLDSHWYTYGAATTSVVRETGSSGNDGVGGAM